MRTTYCWLDRLYESEMTIPHPPMGAGYKVSREKKTKSVKKMSNTSVFTYPKDNDNFGPERKQVLCWILVPSTWCQVREFLRASGFYRIWIPNFYARKIYLWGHKGDCVNLCYGNKPSKRSLRKSSELSPATGLWLPDMSKPFLYIQQCTGIAVGVMTQVLGSWHCRVAYLSKQIDCHSRLATLLMSTCSHGPLGIRGWQTEYGYHSTDINGIYGTILANTWIVRYQGMLCENSCIHLEVVRIKTPMTLMPIQPGPPDHDCIELMDEVFSSQPNLIDQPLEDLDTEYFNDGNNFVKEGKCLSGY